jgi:curved DNA-binding protein CbpA
MSDNRAMFAHRVGPMHTLTGDVTVEHDYYQILVVPPAASANDICDAYRRQAMRHHPDRGGSHETMVLVQEAWEVLSDDGRRARYDASRTAASTVASRKAAAEDTRDARRRAERYPRGWAETSPGPNTGR